MTLCLAIWRRMELENWWVQHSKFNSPTKFQHFERLCQNALYLSILASLSLRLIKIMAMGYKWWLALPGKSMSILERGVEHSSKPQDFTAAKVLAPPTNPNAGQKGSLFVSHTTHGAAAMFANTAAPTTQQEAKFTHRGQFFIFPVSACVAAATTFS